MDIDKLYRKETHQTLFIEFFLDLECVINIQFLCFCVYKCIWDIASFLCDYIFTLYVYDNMIMYSQLINNRKQGEVYASKRGLDTIQ